MSNPNLQFKTCGSTPNCSGSNEVNHEAIHFWLHQNKEIPGAPWPPWPSQKRSDGVGDGGGGAAAGGAAEVQICDLGGTGIGIIVGYINHHCIRITCWWFRIWIWFFHMLGIEIFQLTFIFFRGVETTNQITNHNTIIIVIVTTISYTNIGILTKI